MKEILKKLLDKETMSQAEAISVMDQIMINDFQGEVVAGILTAMRFRGEAPEEIAGFAKSVRRHGQTIQLARPAIDTCGTGGDGSATFNVSTAVAFVVAAGGVGVAKHGNRSVSSRCGSADVFESLGLSIDRTPEEVAMDIHDLGLGFLFAPHYHPALKNIATVRKNLGVKTAFNILGPLVNPAGVRRQVIGVFSSDLHKTMALTLKALGTQEALIVTGEDGLDEISIGAPTLVTHLKKGKIRKYKIKPEDLGLKRCKNLKQLRGGDAIENAQIIENLLRGEKGPKRDIVVINAAAAFLVAGKVATLRQGVVLAQKVLDSHLAYGLLETLRSRHGR